jgi:hypothetical protein
MNWKELNKMLVYLRELGYELDHMSVPQIVELYKEETKC